MAQKSLLDLFEIGKKKKKTSSAIDYEIFGDNLLLHTIKNKLIQRLIDTNTYDEKEINKILNVHSLSEFEKSYLYNVIDNELNHYGPLTELLEYKNVSEVMVNSKDDIYIEIDGKIIKQNNVSFISDDHILFLINRLLESVEKKILDYNAIINTRLKDGFKLSAILAPLSSNGPILTIKKSLNEIQNIEDLLRIGTLTPYMARFLEAAILAKLNILICGNSGSGKTSLLNVLALLIPNNDRIITVEDSKELKLMSPHVISLEKKDDTTLDELIINALNMRPDRLLVGEITGSEGFSLIKALNVGLEGVMTTIYANSPNEALKRLMMNILSEGKETSKAVILEYIVNTIDLIVHIERLSDGRRKIISISELVKIDEDEIKTQTIFAFTKKGITDKNFVMGEFVLYKDIPDTYRKIKTRGIDLLKDIFEE